MKDDMLYASCGDGWLGIITKANEMLSYIDPDYKVDQIKEKFGGLRYYFTPSFVLDDDADRVRLDIMDAIVRDAEYKASYTCEKCGIQGEYNGVKNRVENYWYYTYCRTCSDEVIARREAMRSGR